MTKQMFECTIYIVDHGTFTARAEGRTAGHAYDTAWCQAWHSYPDGSQPADTFTLMEDAFDRANYLVNDGASRASATNSYKSVTVEIVRNP